MKRDGRPAVTGFAVANPVETLERKCVGGSAASGLMWKRVNTRGVAQRLLATALALLLTAGAIVPRHDAVVDRGLGWRRVGVHHADFEIETLVADTGLGKDVSAVSRAGDDE